MEETEDEDLRLQPGWFKYRVNYAIHGAPRSASKLSIDPINSHASYIGKSSGSNKRSVLINATVSSNWNQRVIKD